MRTKGGFVKRRRRRRLEKHMRGYVLGRKLHRMALECRKRALNFAFRDRKVRKREFRRLWITRISAAVKARGLNYSRFINGLKQLAIDLNRKMLSEMAIHDPAGFDALCDQVKGKIGAA